MDNVLPQFQALNGRYPRHPVRDYGSRINEQKTNFNVDNIRVWINEDMFWNYAQSERGDGIRNIQIGIPENQIEDMVLCSEVPHVSVELEDYSWQRLWRICRIIDYHPFLRHFYVSFLFGWKCDWNTLLWRLPTSRIQTLSVTFGTVNGIVSVDWITRDQMRQIVEAVNSSPHLKRVVLAIDCPLPAFIDGLSMLRRNGPMIEHFEVDVRGLPTQEEAMWILEIAKDNYFLGEILALCLLKEELLVMSIST